MGALHRRGDRPSPAEEAAIETLRLREVALLDEVDGRLTRSAKRTRDYTARFKAEMSPRVANAIFDSRAAERVIQDRMLDERLRISGIETTLV